MATLTFKTGSRFYEIAVTVLVSVSLAMMGWFWPVTEGDLYYLVRRWGLVFHPDSVFALVFFFGNIVAILLMLGLLAGVASYQDRIPWSVFFFIGLVFSCGIFPFVSNYFYLLLCGAVGIFLEGLWRKRWQEGLLLSLLAGVCAGLILLLGIIGQIIPGA